MSDLKSKTKELHKLATEQVKATNDYFNKMIELESILADCRMNVSIAKSQNGFALSTVGFIDKRDIEPSVFVKIQNDKFEIIHKLEEEGLKESVKTNVRKRGGGKDSKKEEDDKADKEYGKSDDDDKEEEQKEKKQTSIPQFRPFGVLEPRSAKQARIKAEEAIQRIAELASIQSNIFSLEKEISSLNAEVMSSLGEEYEKLVQINEKQKPSDSVKKLLKTTKWLQVSTQ